jgi:hypothetical protein
MSSKLTTVDFYQEAMLISLQTTDIKVIKNVFSIAFVVLVFGIHVMGSFYLKGRNAAKLNRLRESERVIPLTWMTSWLPLPDVAKYF